MGGIAGATAVSLEVRRTMMTLACLNGVITPADQAVVPIWDRGFLFGDSVYEVFRLYDGRCWQEDEHLDRLDRSLREMQFPGLDRDRLMGRVRETVAAAEVAEGTVYIQITRGVAPRLHAFPNPAVPPTELIVVRPYDDGPTARLRETGVDLISLPDLRWRRCDVKSTNLLANVMANEAAHRAEAYEAVLIDRDGHVTEATHSSLMWVVDGVLIGTPEGPEILPSTTRHHIERLAQGEGIAVETGRVTLDGMIAADEVILSGTTIEVMPAVRIDGRSVGGGRPGPVTRRLQAAFDRAVSEWRSPRPVQV